MAAPPPTLVLMGLRGSGKSTLGAMIAARASLEFIDLDQLSAARLGPGTIAQLWAEHGEARFRLAELDALRDLALERPDSPRRVIALGGGTPTAPGAAELLTQAAEAGLIALVYLRADPDLLRKRLASTDTADRPSLTGAGTLDEIEAVFARRDPLYQRLATRIVDVGGLPAQDLADLLARDMLPPPP